MTNISPRGLEISVTQKGYKVLRLHYTADEEKRKPEWIEAVRLTMPDSNSFRREYEIDWSASTGKPYYPEFVSNYAENKEYYVREIEPLGVPNPIHRGWDFGFRRPACVFFTVDKINRVHVVREISPQSIDIHSFRDLIMYLSGQIDADDASLMRRPRAMSYIDKLKDEKDELPWFKNRTFMDWCGVEIAQTRSIEGEKGERNDAEVLASRNIIVSALPQRISAGEYILRRLLLPQPDGDPGILLRSGNCPILVSGLNGGLTWAKGTKADPLQDKCAKDGYHDHVHDALRYGLVGAVSVVEHFEVGREHKGDEVTWKAKRGRDGRLDWEMEELPTKDGVESYITTWEDW
jgi:hypothetical protein